MHLIRFRVATPFVDDQLDHRAWCISGCVCDDLGRPRPGLRSSHPWFMQTLLNGRPRQGASTQTMSTPNTSRPAQSASRVQFAACAGLTKTEVQVVSSSIDVTQEQSGLCAVVRPQTTSTAQPFGPHVLPSQSGVQTHWPAPLQMSGLEHVPQLPPHPSGPHSFPAQSEYQQGPTAM